MDKLMKEAAVKQELAGADQSMINTCDERLVEEKYREAARVKKESTDFEIPPELEDVDMLEYRFEQEKKKSEVRIDDLIEKQRLKDAKEEAEEINEPKIQEIKEAEDDESHEINEANDRIEEIEKQKALKQKEWFDKVTAQQNARK